VSRQKFKYHGNDVYQELQKQKRERKRQYTPIPPGPNDLTEQKIAERMSRIFIGDRIKFDSEKECYSSNQVDRGGSTIKAIGTVAEHCGGYLMVRLEYGLLESVNYFDIESVNGKAWPWYLRKDGHLTAIEDWERRKWR